LTNSPHRSARAGFSGWFASLPGTWRLKRRYTDGSRFEGTARFLDAHGTMLLAETGSLRICAGRNLEAARNWAWHLRGADGVHIHFRDPARNYLYHDVQVKACANGWTGNAGHDCGADHYRGWYRFENDRIVVRQSVLGPHKNYAFVTHYLRMCRN
jgi:Family of unknown function (DUF6314)